MMHFMYRSDKCGGQTKVVVIQMSGWTNVGRTNVGQTKVAAPLERVGFQTSLSDFLKLPLSKQLIFFYISFLNKKNPNDKSQITYSYLILVYFNKLIKIQLLESVCLCPKVISLNGFRCNYIIFYTVLVTLNGQFVSVSYIAPIVFTVRGSVYRISLDRKCHFSLDRKCHFSLDRKF
jgi:hypothetical protein